MEEIREIFKVVTKSTQATASAAEAVKKAAEDKKTTTTDWSKLITKPTLEEEIKAFREWSWVFEIYLSSVDEAYMKDLKEIHDKPNESFDMDLATTGEKTRCIKLYGFLASLRGGQGIAIG